MTEQNTQTPERKTFKYGDKTYYVDDLLKLHADQKHYFMNFAKDKGRYNGENLNKLQQAIDDRINFAQNNAAFKADGSLDTDVVQNVNNTTYEPTGLFGLHQKEVYTPQDNTEWAKHYIHKLVGNLKPIEEEKPKTNIPFNVDKHGFQTYLTSNTITPDYIYTLDKNTGKGRGYQQRGQQLLTYATQHNDVLTKNGIQFDKDDNFYNDNYQENLATWIKNMQVEGKTFNQSDIIQGLQLLGIGSGDFYNAMTTTESQAGKTDTQIQQEQQEILDKQSKSDEEKKQQEQLEILRNQAAEKYNQLKKEFETKKFSVDNFNSRISNEPNPYNWYTNYDNSTDFRAWFQDNVAPEYQQKFNDQVKKIIKGESFVPATYIGLNYLNNLKEVPNKPGWKYFPEALNNDKLYYIIFNPADNKFDVMFKYDLPEMQKQLFESLKPKPTGEQIYADYKKEGGILKFAIGGYTPFVPFDVSDKSSQKKSNTSTNNTISANNPVIVNKYNDGSVDFNLTNNDWIDLGLAAVNISSILLPPVTGAVTGAASSIGQFANDWNRDGFQWSDAGKLLTNLGMDALGAIPIVGDALGTVGKVKRTLLPLIPKILGGLGTLDAIQNSPQIIDSFKKIIDDRDMTKQDWENIAQGINLLVTGKNQYNVSKKTKDAQTYATSGGNKDNVVLNVRNTKKKLEKIRVTGEPAKKIKDANGDPAKIKNALNETDLFRGYTPVLSGTGPKLQWIYGKTPDSKGWRWPIYMSDGKVKTQEDYNLDDYIDGLGKTTGLERRMVKSKELRTGKSLTDRSNEETQTINDIIQQKQKESKKITTKKPNFESANRELKENRAKMKTNLTKPEKAIEENIPPVFDLRLQNIEIRNNKIKEYLKYTQKKRRKEKLQNEIEDLKNITSVRISKDQKVNVTPKSKQGGIIDINKLNKFLNDGKR